LLPDGLEDVIAPQERHGAAEGLQVVAAAAAGTGIDQHARMSAAQLVPVGKVSLDVVVLGRPLAIRGRDNGTSLIATV